jgi:RNA polymerase sigma-70 factor (ECF subfamily)
MSPSNHQQQSVSEDRRERFLELLLPLRHRLTQFARAMVGGDRDEADDLVGDTILAAFERFDQIRGHEAFLSYLFTIALRIHKRRRWRRKLFGAYDEERAASIRDNGSSPESSADVVLLHRALSRLPERQREAVVLFEITGLSLEEVREIQGGSLSGVKSRVSRGRQELARLLGATDHPAGPARRARHLEDTERLDDHNSSYLIYTESQSNG